MKSNLKRPDLVQTYISKIEKRRGVISKVGLFLLVLYIGVLIGSVLTSPTSEINDVVKISFVVFISSSLLLIVWATVLDWHVLRIKWLIDRVLTEAAKESEQE